MAIRDLFHVCPACGGQAVLAAAGKDERCRACGAVFRRAQGAMILMRLPRGREELRSAGEWLDRITLPDDPPAGATIGPERAILRLAGEARPIHRRRELVGFGERFGPRIRGRVHLAAHTLGFQPDHGTMREWPVERITAVQPTSSALQVKVRGEPVAYLRFLEGSVRLWEHCIHQRLRALYRDRGLGEIVEFQPRITTR